MMNILLVEQQLQELYDLFRKERSILINDVRLGSLKEGLMFLVNEGIVKHVEFFKTKDVWFCQFPNRIKIYLDCYTEDRKERK